MVDAAHPRLIMTDEQWKQAWSLRDLPAFKPVINSLRTQAEGAVAAPLPTVVLPDIFYQPQLGMWDERYAASEELVRTHRQIISPIMSIGQRATAAAVWYRLSGDRHYLSDATCAIQALADLDRVKWSYLNTHAACWTVAHLAVALDCLWNDLDDVTRESARQALTHRTGEMHPHTIRESLTDPLGSHPRVYGLNNTLLGILCLFHHAPEAEPWLWDLLQFIETRCPAMGGDDGGWAVGFGYGGPWLMIRSLHLIRTATGLDYFDMPWMRNQANVLLYFWPAKWACTSFGDAGYGDRPMCREADILARIYNDPLSAWYADQRSVYREDRETPFHLGLLTAYPDRPEAQPPTDLPGGCHLRDVGWVAMHSNLANPEDDMFIQFKSSRYGSYNHCHADQNSFILSAFGQRLLIDSGYYPWYGSEHDKNWTRQTRAHNALLFDRRGQGVWNLDAAGRIVTFVTTPAIDYAIGDATIAYRQPSLHGAPMDLCVAVDVHKPVLRAVRHLLFIRPGTLIILDDCATSRPMSLQFLLHSERAFALDPDARVALLHVNDAAARISFLGSDPLEIQQTNAFSHPPESLAGIDPSQEQWHLTANFAATGLFRRLVTVIQIVHADQLQGLATPLLSQAGDTMSLNIGTIRASFDLADGTARTRCRMDHGSWLEHTYESPSVVTHS